MPHTTKRRLKAGTVAATFALSMLVATGQAQAAGKGVMVQVPVNSHYCQIDVYRNGLYLGGKNLCPQGEGVNLSAGWHHIAGKSVDPGDSVAANYIVYGGRGDTSKGATVPNDSSVNFWYSYRKAGSL